MTSKFCTLFDSFYLTRGLAMIESLFQTLPNSTIVVFAFDNATKAILDERNDSRIITVSLKDFESSELLSVKPQRGIAEYCWTSTPLTIKYCFDHFNFDHCTYLDADIYFFNSPEAILKEVEHSSILITEHRYSAWLDRTEQAGRYCVQFMYFKNNVEGNLALNWWKDRCIEWCYDRYEDGKFGDQKYLDDWTERFAGVKVMENLGGGVAPWNVDQYTFQHRNQVTTALQIDKGLEVDLIFYHFHAFTIYQGNQVNLGNFHFPSSVRPLVYKPYLQHLLRLESTLLPQLEKLGIHLRKTAQPKGLRPFLGRLKRKLLGLDNVMPIGHLLESDFNN